MNTSGRLTLATAIVALALGIAVPLQQDALAQDAATILSRDSVLHDPDIPDLGNPKGDLAIVEYFDYQCPYCKKIAPIVEQVAREDGKIRLVMKDWPIFGPVSLYAARLVLATKYQGQYAAAHRALIGANGKLTESRVNDVLAAAGVDVAKAKVVLQDRQRTIDALLARNHMQAEALGFRGTPSFIVGTFRIPGVLDAANFKRAIADARALATKQKAEPPPDSRK